LSFLEKLKDIANTDVSDLFKKKPKASVDTPVEKSTVSEAAQKTPVDDKKLTKKQEKEKQKIEKQRLKDEKKKEKEQLKQAKKQSKVKPKKKNKKPLFGFLKSKKKLLEEELKNSQAEVEKLEEDVNVFDSIEDDFIQDKELKEKAEEEEVVDEVEILTKDKDSKTIAPDGVTVSEEETISVESTNDQDALVVDEVVSSDTEKEESESQVEKNVTKEEKTIEESMASESKEAVKLDLPPTAVVSNQVQIKQDLSDVESDLGELNVPKEDVKEAVSTGSLIKEGSLLSELDSLITKRHYADEEKRKQKQMKLFTGYQRTQDGSHLLIDDEL
tara:strand:- start:8032 stop:9021 length:990 start_codon:yes stop_codon:yes gene_type:complete